MSEHRYARRVQFAEVDAAQIVHFSRYFRYMEEAEHDFWRAAGLSIAPTDAHVGFARVGASFEYHRPLRFEDEFIVHIRITAMAGKTMTYGCVLTRGEERIATGTMTVICVSHPPGQPMKAMPIPPDVAARFAVAEGEAL